MDKRKIIKNVILGLDILVYIAFISILFSIFVYPSSAEEVINSSVLLSVKDSSHTNGAEYTEDGVIRFQRSDSGIEMIALPLSMINGDAIDVDMDIECSDQVTSELAMDLYDEESLYDSEEADVRFGINKGIHRLKGRLEFGQKHPDVCLLRFFTDGSSHVEISNIKIQRITYKDYTVLKVIAVVEALISCISIIFLLGEYIVDKKHKENIEKNVE